MAKDPKIYSWGRRTACEATFLDAPDFFKSDADSFLPFGLLRSYGDSCLNQNRAMVRTISLCEIDEPNKKDRTIRVQAGVSFDALLKFLVPRGYFLPVTPGTKFITVGGAIANDVHGKNHHQSGTFGCHVVEFGLRRSDGSLFRCSPIENTDLFRATIGGLGLTGLIEWAVLRLKPILSDRIQFETVRFRSLAEYEDINLESDGFEYTVAWLDCLRRDSSGNCAARGIYIRGNHDSGSRTLKAHSSARLKLPVTLPQFMLNSVSMRLFNAVYFHRLMADKKQGSQHYDPFFYPLDGIHDWNRGYGRRGFFQYQFVIPHPAMEPIQEVLNLVSRDGQGSFLSVLKTFGERPSPGLLSFPVPGMTLCLDFPDFGKRTEALMQKIDTVVLGNQGRVYPAKDARMGSEVFSRSFAGFLEFKKSMDPKFSSDFIRRVEKGLS